MKLDEGQIVQIAPDDLYLNTDGYSSVYLDITITPVLRDNSFCVPELRGTPSESVIYWQLPKEHK
jgi:hypothetical protein